MSKEIKKMSKDHFRLFKKIFPVHADKFGSYIWGAKDQMVGMVRGWGGMQNVENAGDYRDFVHQLMVDAINEKFERDY